MSRSWRLMVVLLALALLAGCAASSAARPLAPSTSAPAPTVNTFSTSGATAVVQATPLPSATSTATASPTSAPTTTAPTMEPTSAPATQVPAAPHVIIEMKNYAFVPKTVTVAPGTIVTWRNDDNTTHTATADDKLFDSRDMGQGAEFSYTFTKPGVYPYYCVWHGAPGGQGMSGTVTVK